MMSASNRSGPGNRGVGSRQRLGARLDVLPSYSWRTDPSVPAFPDDKPVIVFDGICVLCSGFVRFVATRDPNAKFRFIAAQSPLGTALYRHLRLDAVNYESNLLIADGKVSAKMEAFRGIMWRLGRGWRAASAIGLLPGWVADGVYDVVARNRCRVFGRYDRCIRFDADGAGASWHDRVIE